MTVTQEITSAGQHSAQRLAGTLDYFQCPSSVLAVVDPGSRVWAAVGDWLQTLNWQERQGRLPAHFRPFVVQRHEICLNSATRL